MAVDPQTVGSVSTTGKLEAAVGYAETNVHISVGRDGTVEIEAGRRASVNETVIAELDAHERRALRDALERTL